MKDSVEIPKSAASYAIRSFMLDDIEYVIERHKTLYSDEYGFEAEFGKYVEKYVYMFIDSYDSSVENLWIVEYNGVRAGMIAIVKADTESAQLRWFLVEPEFRARGIGRLLMKTAIEFCKEKEYKNIFLWTVSILDSARHLYEDIGFTLTEFKENDSWGRHLIEERWDLCL